MDTKCFSYVDSLARTGSYSKSARELYITPQGLSSAMKRLEQSMGVRLFHVADGGVLLTEYGEIFLKYAQKHLSDHANMVQDIEALRRSKSGDMRMAVSTGLFNIIPRDIAEKFAEFSRTGARVSAVRSVVDNDCESGLANGAWDSRCSTPRLIARSSQPNPCTKIICSCGHPPTLTSRGASLSCWRISPDRPLSC